MYFRIFLTVIVLSLSRSATALAEADGNRYATVLAFADEAGAVRNDDETDALIRALERTGYQPAPERDGAKPWCRDIASPGCLRYVVNSLGDNRNSRLLVYLAGHASLRGETIQLTRTSNEPVENEPVELSPLFAQLKREKPDNGLSVVIVLDLCSAVNGPALTEAVHTMIKAYHIPVGVVIGRRGPGAPETPPPLAGLLSAALTYDRISDSDGNGRISLTEFANYASRKLGGRAKLDVVGSPGGESLEFADVRETTLDHIILDLASEVSDLAQREQYTLVAIPDLAGHRGKASQDVSVGDLGTLPRYLSAQLQAQLQLRLGAERIVPWEDLMDALNRCQIKQDTQDEGLDVLKTSLQVKGRLAVLRGSMTIDVQGERVTLTVAARLVNLSPDRKIEATALQARSASLVREETAMAGGVSMGAGTYDGQADSAAKIDELGAEVRFPPHPMSDPNFPVRVRLKVNGHLEKPQESGDKQRLYVRVKAGDKYVIVIENNSGAGLFLRLLVDGRNTLPDREGRGATELKPAQYVSLTRARCWYCEPGKIYEIAGFYTAIDDANRAGRAPAELRTFQVRDARLDVAGGDYPEQLGIITAAFYDAVPKGSSRMASEVPQYATELGEARAETVQIYAGKHGPGGLFLDTPPINIRYGF